MKNVVSSDKDIQRVSLLMAVNCVRNTIIEDYHKEGKITDEEIKNFNKAKINSFNQKLGGLLR